MQRSSETIGTIAAALAKAQGQLVNPEKSQTGTIRADVGGGRGSERSFRYAPLSSGLDIVRKTLSQHEIATVQITSIDETAGIVRLSTVLAHASGEWIASDWPVCAISETAAPHRMGAALTYARRYALFTLVGIAGEDDFDAPDLLSPAVPETKTDHPIENGKDRLNGRQGQSFLGVHRTKAGSTSSAMLEPAASVALRDRLITDLSAIGSSEEAANRAHRIIGLKNTLSAIDSGHVEEAFQSKLATFGTARFSAAAAETRADRRKKRRKDSAIDKGVLALPTPRRIRDREHVKSVSKQPCLICGRHPADAHHLRFAQSRSLGSKVSDEFTVPLCRGHHREVHRCGDEPAWWKKIGIDPTAPARILWLKSHPLPTSVGQSESKLQNEPNLETRCP